MELKYEIIGGDFNLAGKASSEIKKVLKQLEIDSKIIKRIVVAVYEAEVNVVAHSVGGRLSAKISSNEITISVADDGPGIENIEQAMTVGFSTATTKVREMGFGAGMGLPNIKKNTDKMDIESVLGKGTTLSFTNRF